MTGSGTSARRTFPMSSKTTARTLPVGELRLDGAGEMHQLVRRADVPNDRGEVAMHPQLPLHHPPHGIEVSFEHLPPSRVRRPDHESRGLRLAGIDDPAAAALSVPAVQ